MKDALLNADNDMYAVNGDIATGDDSRLTDQRLILLTAKNDWKQNPKLGVDIENFLEDENPQALYREIREQINLDGMKVTTLTTNTSGQIELEAE